MLTLRQLRKRSLALHRPPTSAWLSFLPHRDGKLNHTQSSPPATCQGRRVSMKKAAGPRTGGLVKRVAWG